MNKLVFITSRFPYPLNKGDKLRVYFQLKYLSETYDIHLIAISETKINPTDIEALRPYCASIEIYVLPLYKRIISILLSPFRSIPLQVAFFYNKSIHRQILQKITNCSPQHIHCHLIRTTQYVRGVNNISTSVDFMDAFGVGMEKRARIAPTFFHRWLFNYEKRQLYAYEASVFQFIDRFCIISEQDKNHIKSNRSNEISIIPNGVDFDMFYPREEPKKYDLVFMGNLGYPPNVEAMFFLIYKIMPLVWKKNKNITLLLAGIDAPRKIKELAKGNIVLIENFSNISHSIAQSKVMVAPMQISIGLQNKIIQSMAMKVPCVVSRSSNKAIQAPHGEALIEAEEPIEYANAIVSLLEDKMVYEHIANEGYEFVHRYYSWQKQNDLMIQLFTSPIEK